MISDSDGSISGDDVVGYTITPLPDFKALARDIQNRGARRMGTDPTETRHFREFFGTRIVVVERVWELLERDSLLPEGSDPKHLLWALHFMKVYPKQGPGCAVAGASHGAIDPKTHHKWVWGFMDAIAKLLEVVVSQILRLKFYCYNVCLLLTSPSQPQIVFESRLGPHDMRNDCTMSVDGTDFRIPQKGPTFALHKYAGKSAVRYELGVDIIAGNLVWI